MSGADVRERTIAQTFRGPFPRRRPDACPWRGQVHPAPDALADPPVTARLRAWWPWMNGNITKDGIAKDLAWMKAVGIGGALLKGRAT
ncbi:MULTISPECIES: glycosyl hydrolase [unclassified Novosphingobium]|nr:MULTISPECIES: glycosyl hydrolase [unclassified Novosphingobium]